MTDNPTEYTLEQAIEDTEKDVTRSLRALYHGPEINDVRTALRMGTWNNRVNLAEEAIRIAAQVGEHVGICGGVLRRAAHRLTSVQRWRDYSAKVTDQKLADDVTNLIDVLDEAGAIERCHHRSCKRLAVGEPDFGPNVEAAVCDEHVPAGIERLIDCQRDVTDALRYVFADLEKYGIVYDADTGRRKS